MQKCAESLIFYIYFSKRNIDTILAQNLVSLLEDEYSFGSL